MATEWCSCRPRFTNIYPVPLVALVESINAPAIFNLCNRPFEKAERLAEHLGGIVGAAPIHQRLQPLLRVGTKFESPDQAITHWLNLLCGFVRFLQDRR
jgi:hypothetical protein